MCASGLKDTGPQSKSLLTGPGGQTYRFSDSVPADVEATYRWNDPWRHCYGQVHHFRSEAVEKLVNVLPS